MKVNYNLCNGFPVEPLNTADDVYLEYDPGISHSRIGTRFIRAGAFCVHIRKAPVDNASTPHRRITKRADNHAGWETGPVKKPTSLYCQTGRQLKVVPTLRAYGCGWLPCGPKDFPTLSTRLKETRPQEKTVKPAMGFLSPPPI